MKNRLFYLLLIFFVQSASAHTVDYNQVLLHQWKLSNHKTISGSFYMANEGIVTIEDGNHTLIKVPLNSLSADDRVFVSKKMAMVKQLNESINLVKNQSSKQAPLLDSKLLIVVTLLLLFGLVVFRMAEPQKRTYLLPVLSVGVLITLFSFGEKVARKYRSITNPALIDSAFTPFKPNVHTLWDANYFYVESHGIPTTHEMMAGISNHGWQQQVPIPQCYIGNNAWSIPLNPAIASTPVPVSPAHFTRGAIAIAVNGVAIFNPYTNTGVDALVDGQLDAYGGHCGRGDDYHYHIAPLSLYNHTSATLPIAFGLDGYAVYGSVEPDGSAMAALDANHGHFGTNGVYHYHGTVAFPYMIANMVGQVTEDTTHQIIPQAVAHPVRPALTPLSGALITSCVPNGTNNGYSVNYTMGGQNYSVEYSWTLGGVYTFNFVSPTGTTTSVYNGFTPCDILTILSEISESDRAVTIYPNPALNVLTVQFNSLNQESEVRDMTIYSIKGDRVFSVNHFQKQLDLNSLSKGVYLLKIQLASSQLTKKFIIE